MSICLSKTKKTRKNLRISSTENHTETQLLVTDMMGRTVISQKINVVVGSNQILISNGDLQVGTYMVTVEGVDEHLKPIKVVVNH